MASVAWCCNYNRCKDLRRACVQRVVRSSNRAEWSSRAEVAPQQCSSCKECIPQANADHTLTRWLLCILGSSMRNPLKEPWMSPGFAFPGHQSRALWMMTSWLLVPKQNWGTGFSPQSHLIQSSSWYSTSPDHVCASKCSPQSCPNCACSCSGCHWRKRVCSW